MARRPALGRPALYLAYIVLALIHRTGGRRHPLEAPAYAAADRVRAAMLEELEK